MNRALVVALASLVLAGCTAPGQKPGEAGTSMPSFSLPGIFSRDNKPIIADLKSGRYEASSLAVGQQKDLARHRGENLGFVPSPALESYLDSIRVKLVLASGVTDVPGKVVILASRDLAAYSTPDGNVYLAVAWLDDLETEDELGAIIAHEQSHVLLKHHSADILAGVQKRAQAVQELAVSAKTQLEKTPVVAKSDQRGLANAQMLADAGDKVIMPAWGRSQEREADLLGVDLYPPLGLQALWPFDSGWYISGLDLFPQTRREHLLTWPVLEQNFFAVVQEAAILVPIVVALWLVREKALAGLAPEETRRHHPPE